MRTIVVIAAAAAVFLSWADPAHCQAELEEAAMSREDFNFFILETRKYRDPFLPLIRDAKQAPTADRIFESLKLQGIVWDQANPLVIINGKIYEVGEEVEGALVTKISKDKVYLAVNDKTYSLMFWEEEGGKGGEKK